MKKSISLPLGAAALAALVFALVHYRQASPSPAATAAAEVPVSVAVQTVAAKNMRLWSEFSGRLRAVDFAQIRPEVGGRITEVRFEDGQSVKAGDILLVIDPRPYQAAVEKAEAQVASAQADARYAAAEKDRAASMFEAQAIAKQEFDRAQSADRMGDAALKGAQAQLDQARIDLDHAYVKAPISGRVSRAEITVGNLVENGPNAPLLTSIVSENGIYADFEVDEQTYLETIRDTANGNDQEQRIPVELVLSEDKGHSYQGFIQSFDNRIDTASGTIRARAKFENADRTLVPGMFVSVRLAGSRERTALLVPERAIVSDQSRKFVYVVSPENRVEYREIATGRRVQENRVIEKGLEAGDRVVVDGVQHVRPHALVQASELPAAVAAQQLTAAQTAGGEAQAR